MRQMDLMLGKEGSRNGRSSLAVNVKKIENDDKADKAKDRQDRQDNDFKK